MLKESLFDLHSITSITRLKRQSVVKRDNIFFANSICKMRVALTLALYVGF